MYSWIKRAFRKEDKGVASIEFAIILPLLTYILIGIYDVSTFVFCADKMQDVAQQVSNIVTRGTATTTAQVNTLLQASAVIAQPFNFTANGKVIVTCVTLNTTTNKAQESWQLSYGSGAGVSKLSLNSLPGGLTPTANQSYIFTEVFYAYQPLIPNYVLQGSSKTLYSLTAAVPRQGQMSTLN